jgi:multidrug transporter EmrE-like cation transporter
MTGGRTRRALVNPYLQLLVGQLMITAAEVMLKKGATGSVATPGEAEVLGFTALTSGSTWLGIVFYTLSFLIWLHVLRLLPLTQAYALASIVHVLVPTAAWLFLNEVISSTRAAGIALVLCGVVLVATPAAKAEEEL